MRVIGYVREFPGSEATDTAFMQAERVRRWVARNAYTLISICQDTAESPNRDGYGALLGIVASGQADIVIVPTLTALSPDKVVQEVMLFELRRTGISVASTEETDLLALTEPPTDPARLFIRDVLEKAAAHRSIEVDGNVTELPSDPEPDEVTLADPDVIVEFVQSLPTTEPDPNRVLA